MKKEGNNSLNKITDIENLNNAYNIILYNLWLVILQLSRMLSKPSILKFVSKSTEKNG